MSRIVKAHDERKNEILDAAWDLFFGKGYDETSVNAIIEKVGVAKGTFYHYFSSKEELLDALAARHADSHIAEWEEILNSPELNALEKLRKVMDVSKRLKVENRDLALFFFRMFYKKENFFLRYKIDNAVVKKAEETLTRIVEDGCREGIFSTPYPKEVIRMLIKLGNDLTEQVIGLLLEAEEDPRMIDGIVHHYDVYRYAMERLLGLEPGSIRFFDRDFLVRFFRGTAMKAESEMNEERRDERQSD